MKRIRDSIGVHTVYTWPNRINLISSLKDPDFRVRESIPTWQRRGRLIGSGKKVEIKEALINRLLIEKLNSGSLTVETPASLTKELQARKDRIFEGVIEKGLLRALMSSKVIDGVEHVAYYYVEGSYLMDCRIEERESVINQIWIGKGERSLMRSALKVGFEQSGPVFNMGMYSLCEDSKNIEGSARMYHHDVF